MNLIDAIKSGKRFRRISGANAWYTNDTRWYTLNKEVILATDWEIEGAIENTEHLFVTGRAFEDLKNWGVK